MGVWTTIRNAEPEGSARLLKAVVVTAGQPDAGEQRHVLAPQQELSLELQGGQFVMVDETEKEGV